ncbi:MAG: hypothetical protein OK457_00510 [Thaumarchaeota archaeon]|nr:hypothetical protein [Nitrososphaerota archaeon]
MSLMLLFAGAAYADKDDCKFPNEQYVQKVTVKIDQLQLLSLVENPVLILPAKAGQMIIVLPQSYALYDAGTVPYFNPSASQFFYLYTGDPAVAVNSFAPALNASGFVDQVTDQVETVIPGYGPAAKSEHENKPLLFSLLQSPGGPAVQDLTNGNGFLLVTVYYIYVPVTD